MFLAEKREPVRLAPKQLTAQLKEKTKIPAKGTTSPESTYEIGFVYAILGPKYSDGDVSDMETDADTSGGKGSDG